MESSSRQPQWGPDLRGIMLSLWSELSWSPGGLGGKCDLRFDGGIGTKLNNRTDKKFHSLSGPSNFDSMPCSVFIRIPGLFNHVLWGTCQSYISAEPRWEPGLAFSEWQACGCKEHRDAPVREFPHIPHNEPRCLTVLAIPGPVNHYLSRLGFQRVIFRMKTKKYIWAFWMGISQSEEQKNSMVLVLISRRLMYNWRKTCTRFSKCSI